MSNLIVFDQSAIPAEILQEIKNTFTYPNPLFYKLKAMGIRVQPWQMFYKTYRTQKDKMGICRGCFIKFTDILKKYNIEYQIIDETTKNEEVNFKILDSLNFFEYQQYAIDEMTKFKQNILISDTGTGKTLIMLGIIAKLKQNSLILVPSSVIFKSYKDDIAKAFGKKYQYGEIGYGKFDIKPITISTIQSTYHFDEAKWDIINKYFGLVGISECNHIPADKFFKMINNFKAQYRYAETASKTRKDKMEFLMLDTVSNRLVEITKEQLESDKKSLSADVNFIKCEFVKYESVPKINKETGEEIYDIREWAKVTEMLLNNEERNNLIMQSVKRDIDNKRICLVLSDRIKHCKYLHKLFNDNGINCAILTGDIDVETRNKTINQVRNKKYDVIVATSNLAGEGMDIPILSSVHLTTPSNNLNLSKQRTGRIRRVLKDKPFPLIHDYVDVRVEMFRVCGFSRLKHYRSFNFNILNKI